MNSLEAAREVLQTHGSSFVKPAFFEKLVGEMMGTGVLFSVGEQHKQLRRIMAGEFVFGSKGAAVYFVFSWEMGDGSRKRVAFVCLAG